MADSLRMNDRTFSWSSIIWKLFDDRWTGLVSIDYDDALEVTLGYGLGKHHAPIARSAGKYVPSPVKIKVYAKTAQRIIDEASARSVGGLSYGQVEFPMTLQLIEPGDDPLTVTFDRCRIVKGGSAYAEGPELLMQDMELSVMAIYRNKKTLFDSSRGVP